MCPCSMHLLLTVAACHAHAELALVSLPLLETFDALSFTPYLFAFCRAFLTALASYEEYHVSAGDHAGMLAQ